jgi:branched-chain amino acid transport system substrate-binding protein
MLEGYFRINASRTSEPITIGVILPLTGAMGVEGREIYEAYQIARDIVHDKGGVNGRPVYLDARDSPSAGAATLNAKELIRKRVPVVMGSMANELGLAACPIIQQGGGTYLETTAVSEDFTGGAKHVFRASAAGAKMGTIGVDFLARRVLQTSRKRVSSFKLAIVYEHNWVLVARAARQRANELGFGITICRELDPSMLARTTLISHIKALKVDAVLVGGWLTDVVDFRRAAVAAGLQHCTWIGLSAGHSINDYSARLGSDAEGVFVVDSSFVVPDTSLQVSGLDLKREALARWQRRRPGHIPCDLAWEAFCERSTAEYRSTGGKSANRIGYPLRFKRLE